MLARHRQLDGSGAVNGPQSGLLLTQGLLRGHLRLTRYHGLDEGYIVLDEHLEGQGGY